MGARMRSALRNVMPPNLMVPASLNRMHKNVGRAPFLECFRANLFMLHSPYTQYYIFCVLFCNYYRFIP